MPALFLDILKLILGGEKADTPGGKVSFLLKEEKVVGFLFPTFPGRHVLLGHITSFFLTN
jgi:hypothetical protein